MGCVDQGRVVGRGGSCSGGWRAEMDIRTGWALVGRTSPSLKLEAALCTRGTDYEGTARGCSGCKMTPWKQSCKMQANNQQVPVRDKFRSPSPKHQLCRVPMSCWAF